MARKSSHSPKPAEPTSVHARRGTGRRRASGISRRPGRTGGMRILFATTRGAGHVGPLIPFARAAAAAGHDVLARPGVEHRARRARRRALDARRRGAVTRRAPERAWAPVWSPETSPGMASVVQELFDRPARAGSRCRGCSTRRAVPPLDGGVVRVDARASPPAPPGGRARRCRGSSRCCPAPRRRGCRRSRCGDPASPSRMKALAPCHSSTPKSASKTSVSVDHGIVPAHPRLAALDVGLRRARDVHERRVAGVEVREVGDLVRHERAAAAAALGPAAPRRARRRSGRRSAGGARRTGRSGSAGRPGPRTRSPSPRPSAASGGARRPARRARGSAPSP